MPSSKHSDAIYDLARIYTNNISWLNSWLRRRLSCSDTAADLAQDTFLRLLAMPNSEQKIAEIREHRPYIASVAKTVLIDHFRRCDLELAYKHALMQQPEPETISAEESALILDTLYRLDRMLDGLGKNIKTAFLLSQLRGLNYKQIADKLGVTESSVKKYMAKAMQHCLIFAAMEQL